MKERFKFECFKIYNEKKGLEEMQYFKIKQELTWQFYFRTIKMWFIPCKKCQDKIEELWIEEISTDRTILFNAHLRREFLAKVTSSLCIKDLTGIVNYCKGANEIIIGNKDYEPPVELSRKWLDDEDSRIRISIEDYNQRNEQAVEQSSLHVNQEDNRNVDGEL